MLVATKFLGGDQQLGNESPGFFERTTMTDINITAKAQETITETIKSLYSDNPGLILKDDNVSSDKMGANDWYKVAQYLATNLVLCRIDLEEKNAKSADWEEGYSALFKRLEQLKTDKAAELEAMCPNCSHIEDLRKALGEQLLTSFDRVRSYKQYEERAQGWYKELEEANAKIAEQKSMLLRLSEDFGEKGQRLNQSTKDLKDSNANTEYWRKKFDDLAKENVSLRDGYDEIEAELRRARIDRDSNAEEIKFLEEQIRILEMTGRRCKTLQVFQEEIARELRLPLGAVKEMMKKGE